MTGRRSLHIATLAWAIASLGACGGRPDGREFRDFERMRRQQRYDSYDAGAHFANGATMQAPPLHTVSREADLRSGDTLVITDSALAMGRRQYAISCAGCHGAAGYGGGPLAPNLTERRPAPLRGAAILSATPAALFATITDGKGGMPPLGWQLTPEQRWAVIAYVRSLSMSTLTEADLADARADSAMASYLRQIDSLHAAGARIETIAGLPRPSLVRATP